MQGKPLIAGKLVSQTEDNVELEAISQFVDGLPLPTASENGACQDGLVEGIVVSILKICRL